MNRRKFLGESACAALGSTSVMSTLLNLKMAGQAVAAGLPASGTDHKTLVCIFLHGGIDSFNVLVPRDAARYAEYAASRTNLALSSSSLLTLNQTGGNGELYGLHPGTGELEELFNGMGGDALKRRLAFVANVGTLIQPTSLSDYQNENVSLPRALFSHIDQIEQWQTSLPQGASNLTGWAGRAADVLHCTHNQELTSMSLSFAGNNIFQVGNTTQQFVMTPGGALSFSQQGSNSYNPTVQKNIAVKSLVEQHYTNLIETAFADLTRQSVEQQEFVQEQFDSLPEDFVTTEFPNSSIAQQLQGALRMIRLREELGLRRQTIFLSFGGWDHHGELLDNQDAMLRILSPALGAFQAGLEELELADSVISFTASDFGRTLRSNGRGTDHAWGGNQLVMGGPVAGGQVAGTYPSLALDGPNDVGRGGRLLPSTSVDELFAELLLWFGLAPNDFEEVLPNLSNFYDPYTAVASDPATLPVGFLKPNQF
ncbi:DUF1501 domain-containing protein [Roseibacillus persicicus]|uniref:DUF1501 domain-containing protein n=1 Tax=Roseibacillus persicicus TaxID=454148 RepID=UPI00280FF009|nr:DUF1501 domain-containing protein [Roseibacillus persicicus]MDQ8189951.1 DUF1501 domain-containing protein [Roseibacillus persicicus]